VVGHLKEQIMAEAARGRRGGAALRRERAVHPRQYPVPLGGRAEFDDDILILDGDVLFPQELLARMIATPMPTPSPWTSASRIQARSRRWCARTAGWSR
jgi:hypothetical protein